MVLKNHSKQYYSIIAIAYIDLAVGFPCVVPSDDGISVPQIINNRDGMV